MKYLFAISICFALFTQLDAQSKPKKIETCEFTVKGVCNMCEARIEKAALIKGVKMVEWNKDNQSLKVIYATNKVSEKDIHTAIANAGHDTEQVEAPKEVYATLPDCCAYRDGVKAH